MLPNVMKAVIAEGLDKPFVVGELPVQRPGPGQVLVRMHASGVCPTDTSIATGSWLMKRPPFPYVPGHEGCGVVAALGQGVAKLKEGDRVGVFWLNSTCGTCEYCSCGRENLCGSQESTGYTRNGTHAQYCLVDAEYVVPLPPGDFRELTPIMCAGVTAYKAVKELGGKSGDVTVVLGVGGTGHLAIQYALAEGRNVIAVDLEEEKLQLALSLGAHSAINANDFPVNKVMRATGGAHGVIMTAPVVKAFDQGMRMLRRGGVCVLVGVGEEAVSIPPFPTVINELSVRGTVSGTRDDLVEALDLVERGAVRGVVKSRPLEEVNLAIQDIKQRKVPGRMVLTID